jgi:hypothetical protein
MKECCLARFVFSNQAGHITDQELPGILNRFEIRYGHMR